MNDPFSGRTPDREKMLRYGFREEGGALVYEETLSEDFTLTLSVTDEKVSARLTDRETGEPYTLHLVEDAQGEFVGRVREMYALALGRIAERCFTRRIFVCKRTDDLIAFVREKYGDEPEYLWEKFPDNAVFRRKDNGKWYAAILTVERKKLGMKGEGKTEVLDVRADPREVPLLVDGEKIFGGWHMNKKHWISLPLDGSVPMEELAERLEESCFIAGRR